MVVNTPEFTAMKEALKKVSGKVKKAYLLADARHKALKVSQKADAVTVALPAQAPDPVASVIVLETAK